MLRCSKAVAEAAFLPLTKVTIIYKKLFSSAPGHGLNDSALLIVLYVIS